MTNEFKLDLNRRLASFIADIGLEIEAATIDVPTFLPGILNENGRILADEDKLTYPGDLLHEAP